MRYHWKVEKVSAWKLQDYLNDLEANDYEIIYMEIVESRVSFGEDDWLVIAKVPVVEADVEGEDVNQMFGL